MGGISELNIDRLYCFLSSFNIRRFDRLLEKLAPDSLRILETFEHNDFGLPSMAELFLLIDGLGKRRLD
jgi:hypothetical protein